MPRSVYWPFMHISQCPAAHAGQGTGSRRRTMPTTRSPGTNPVSGAASPTRPSDSCPMMRRSFPGGGDPYSPLMISRSVPQIPIACVCTTIGPSSAGGSGMSVSATESCCPGMTVMARIPHRSKHTDDSPLPPGTGWLLPILIDANGLDPLDDGCGGHGAAGAHGDQRGAGVAPLELMQRASDQPGAGGADRVAEGDRPAVDVDPVLRRLEYLQPGQHDGGESLVDLEQVDVREGHPAGREHPPGGRDRAVEVEVRLRADQALRDDPRSRPQLE